MKEPCGIIDSVNYNLEVVLTRTEILGCCYKSSRYHEDPKKGVGRNGCLKLPFPGGSHDKRW